MINYLAVLASAIASMIIGAIWYGPLFGKMFSHEMGFEKLTPEEREPLKKKMGISYGLQFIGSLVMFFVLDWYVVTSFHTGLTSGLGNAFGVWIGFVVPLALSNTIWGGKWKLFWLNIGCMFVTLMAAGLIMGLWM
jgi:hypothetical protein